MMILPIRDLFSPLTTYWYRFAVFTWERNRTCNNSWSIEFNELLKGFFFMLIFFEWQRMYNSVKFDVKAHPKPT